MRRLTQAPHGAFEVLTYAKHPVDEVRALWLLPRDDFRGFDVWFSSPASDAIDNRILGLTVMQSNRTPHIAILGLTTRHADDAQRQWLHAQTHDEASLLFVAMRAFLGNPLPHVDGWMDDDLETLENPTTTIIVVNEEDILSPRVLTVANAHADVDGLHVFRNGTWHDLESQDDVLAFLADPS